MQTVLVQGTRGTWETDVKLPDSIIETSEPKTKTKATRPPMASVAGLLYRGWTRGLVSKLLGEPDKLVRNPHYASAAPMRLYLMERVTEAEETIEYRNCVAKLGPRRQAAQQQADARAAKAAERREARKTQTLEAIEAEPIAIRMVDPLGIIPCAIGHWNANSEDGYISPKTLRFSDKKPVPADFIARLVRNFMRHELSNYDELLDQFVQQDDWEIYSSLKTRVERAIDDAYRTVGFSYFNAAPTSPRDINAAS